MPNYQTKRRIVNAVQFNDPDNLPEGVYAHVFEDELYYRLIEHYRPIKLTDWIIDGREVMADEKFREMYEEVREIFCRGGYINCSEQFGNCKRGCVYTFNLGPNQIK
jgi:hypothetical protein